MPGMDHEESLPTIMLLIRIDTFDGQFKKTFFKQELLFMIFFIIFFLSSNVKDKKKLVLKKLKKIPAALS